MTDWPFGDLKKNHYGVIYADPPWSFKTWSGPEKSLASRGTVAPYKTMSMDELRALPVADLAADNCMLICWIVWPTLPEALQLIKDWGFTYKTCAFSWMKADVSTVNLFPDEVDARMGLGYYTRSNSEVALLATRGKPKRKSAYVRQGIIAPIREHSRKPDGVHGRIEELTDGAYCELFGRQLRSGWDVWGNQTERFTPTRTHNTDEIGNLNIPTGSFKPLKIPLEK